MNALSNLANMLIDCMIAATALYALYRALRWLLNAAEQRWPPAPAAPIDPAAVLVWDVLAEARHITETAGSTDATE